MYPLLVFYRNIDCRKFIEYRKLFGTVFGTDIDTIISKSSIRYTTLVATAATVVSFLGDGLLIEIVRTTRFGGCLLIGIVWTIGYGDWL